jgi:hypothetical protein
MKFPPGTSFSGSRPRIIPEIHLAMECPVLEYDSPFHIFGFHRLLDGLKNRRKTIPRDYPYPERFLVLHLSKASIARCAMSHEVHGKATRFLLRTKSIFLRLLSNMRMEEERDAIQRFPVEEIAEKLCHLANDSEIQTFRHTREMFRNKPQGICPREPWCPNKLWTFYAEL